MQHTNKYPPGYCLFAGSNCPEHIEAAKDYIKDHALTKEDVDLLGTKEEILILTKKDVELK